MKKLDIYLQNARIKKTLPFINSGDHILDIGSGDGPLFKYLDSKNISYSGVGLEPEIAEEIQEKHYRILKEKFPNNRLADLEFNVITAMAVLEHIPKEGLHGFAEACNHRLKSGGHLVITVPSKYVDYVLKVLISLRVLDGMEVDQHYGYDTKWTEPLFTKSGFVLQKHAIFQLGLNNLFVFRKK